MFVDFFYILRESGVPVSPTSFLRLHQALSLGLVNGLDDFYTAARSTLVKSERYFDIYDRVFAHFFQGAELPDFKGIDLDVAARELLDEWLKHPKIWLERLGISKEKNQSMSPEELIKYFLDRLKEQTEAHHGGAMDWNRRNLACRTLGLSSQRDEGWWPIHGQERDQSALDRRYKDYSLDAPLTQAQMGEALKRLRRMVPVGPKDQVNVDDTIRATTRKPAKSR